LPLSPPPPQPASATTRKVNPRMAFMGWITWRFDWARLCHALHSPWTASADEATNFALSHPWTRGWAGVGPRQCGNELASSVDRGAVSPWCGPRGRVALLQAGLGMLGPDKTVT
jgi:hypothetical protein